MFVVWYCSLSVYLSVCLCGVVWHTGTTKRSELELEDEDQFTTAVDGWKRINTLSHYNVQDNSTIHLVIDTSDTGQNTPDDDPHMVLSGEGLPCVCLSVCLSHYNVQTTGQYPHMVLSEKG